MDSERTATTRRRFLGTAAGATGAVLATSVLRPSQAAAAVPIEAGNLSSAGTRTFAAANVALELGGVSQGFLKSADGADTFADVTVAADGTKRIGPPMFDDLQIVAGFGLKLDFCEWVVGFVDGTAPSRAGAILSLDLQRNVKAARGFQNGLITELAIPACNGSSRDPGFLSLTIAPESATDLTPTGTVPAPSANQKAWLTSNFKLEIDDLDCTKVAKIDAITIKQPLIDNLGGSRDAVRVPGRIEYPNLVVTFSVASLASWKKFFTDFVINGINGQTNEKQGKLTLLAADHVTEFAVLQLHHIGIFRLDPDPEPVGGGEQVARATAELYVETMNFSKLGAFAIN